MVEKKVKEKADLISKKVIGAAIEVHKTLGPGLLESVYEECLAFELNTLGLSLSRQEAIAINYKGMKLDCSYRADMIVEELVILELKSVEAILPIHEAQLLTYLKLSKKWLGLLINFNESLLKHGIKRLVNG